MQLQDFLNLPKSVDFPKVELPDDLSTLPAHTLSSLYKEGFRYIKIVSAADLVEKNESNLVQTVVQVDGAIKSEQHLLFNVISKRELGRRGSVKALFSVGSFETKTGDNIDWICAL